MGEASRVFGRYVLLHELGRGAMGVVWKAHEPSLDRHVALKFLQGVREEDLARFRREAQLAAALQHPNIAAIHAVGEEDGKAYLAMQYIDGKPLDQWPLSPVEAAASIREAARAIHSAHGQGVIHRDLKPQNILRTAAGQVYVTDFGLAKRHAAASSISMTGMVVGTPSYMPPEQARGAREVGARSDVYSLGATLYHLLTGRAPFQGADAMEVLLQVLDADAVPPARLQPKVHPDLNTIVLKCLDKDPGRRYATAAELADDLQRFLDHEPILARPSTVLSRVWRRILTHRRAWIGTAAALFAGLSVAAYFRLSAGEAERRRREAHPYLERARDKIENLRGEAMRDDATKEKLTTRAREAAAEIEKALRIDPQSAEAYQLLGRARFAALDYEEAMAELDRAVELRPDDPSIRLDRARAGSILYEAERGTALLGETTSLVGLPQRGRETERSRAIVAKAREDLAVAERFTTSMRGLHLARGMILTSQEKWAEALAEFDRAVDELNVDSMAFFLRARALLMLHRWNDAIRDLEQAIKYQPLFAEAHMNLGLARHFGGDNEGALRSFMRALELEPKNPGPYVNAATVLLMRNEPRKAIEFLDKVLAAHPAHGVALVNRGNARSMLREFEEALRDYDAAILHDPGSSLAFYNRGQCYAYLNRIDEAIADFSEAIRINDRFVFAYGNRAQAYSMQRKFDLALADADRILDLSPNLPKAWFQRGCIRLEMGDGRRALADFEKALEIEPDLERELRPWLERARKPAPKD